MFGGTSQGGSGFLNGRTSSYGSISIDGPGRERDTAPLSQSQESESGYTELMHGSVPCPTCRGLGNVPKEQEGQLIALIPMKDKRLRPRRTYLWVCLAVFFSLLAAGLLLFFMFPRSVEMISTRPYLRPVGAVHINVSKEYVNFIVMNHVNISNNNYFSVKITSTKMSVLYDTQVLDESSNMTQITVPIRGLQQHFVMANITMDSHNEMGYMASACNNSIRWAHEMVMIFEFTCSYEYLGHTEETSLQTYQIVSCYSRPTTTVAPTTKPTTTANHTTHTTTTKHTTHTVHTTHKHTTPEHTTQEHTTHV